MDSLIRAIALTLGAVTATAYPVNYGPFAGDAEVERVELTELTTKPWVAATNGPLRGYAFTIPEQEESRLIVGFTRESRAMFAVMMVNGKTVMPLQTIDDFATFSGLSVYSGDLNLDEVADLAIFTYCSAACGLATAVCNLTFVLSSAEGYAPVTVTTMFAELDSFVVVDRQPCFILVSLEGVDECNDGRNHNFWVYNLLTFDKDGVRVANDMHAAFPKTIWYTFKPNHSETTIITDEQKAKLHKESLTGFYRRKTKELTDEEPQLRQQE